MIRAKIPSNLASMVVMSNVKISPWKLSAVISPQTNLVFHRHRIDNLHHPFNTLRRLDRGKPDSLRKWLHCLCRNDTGMYGKRHDAVLLLFVRDMPDEHVQRGFGNRVRRRLAGQILDHAQGSVLRTDGDEFRSPALPSRLQHQGSKGLEDGDVVQQIDVEELLVHVHWRIRDAGFMMDDAGVGDHDVDFAR